MMTKFIASACGLWVCRFREDDTGIIIAAPMPCSVRAATSIGTFTDKPQTIEERVNSVTAIANTRRVPKRSAIQPLTGMQTARLRM